MKVRKSWVGMTMVLLGCGELVGPEADEAAEAVGGEQVAQQRSALTAVASKVLMITSTTVTRNSARTSDPCSAVAGDENKVWTIGHLLKREAEKNGLTPLTYGQNWINAWNSSPQINGQTIPQVMGSTVRSAWTSFGGSTLPLHKAPFYLLAIVSRLDLRQHRPAGEPLGGEVRFIFGILAPLTPPACPTGTADALSTVIFEYATAKADENAVRDLARRWYDLRNLTQNTAGYRTALQTLTEEVVNSGRLMRVRVNESANATVGWQLTEFEPSPTGAKYLVRSTIKQSPTMALLGANSTLLGQYIMTNAEALQGNEGRDRGFNYDPIGSYLVPDRFNGTNTFFRGSFNTIPGSSTDSAFWNAPNPGMQEASWSKARHLFSLGTCNGCHGRETQTGFLHVIPSSPGSEAGLSLFLQGSHTVNDPVTGFPRTFNVMAQREQDLDWLVNGGAVATPVHGNSYEMVFSTGGRCMDASGNNNNENAGMQAFTCHGNGNQRLQLLAQGMMATPNQGVRQMYNLKFKHSGKCVDVLADSTASGARVVQRTCDGSNSQKLWLSGTNGPTFYRLFHFLHSDLCPVVQSTAESAPVVQVPCTFADAQGFKFVE
jgi:hypothetical protein